MDTHERNRALAEQEQRRQAADRSRVALVVAGHTGCKTATAEVMRALGISRADAEAARSPRADAA